MRKIAFLINNEIFHVMHLDESQYGVYAGMMSNPKIVDISEHQLFAEPGSLYMNEQIYVPASKFTSTTTEEPDYEVE